MNLGYVNSSTRSVRSAVKEREELDGLIAITQDFSAYAGGIRVGLLGQAKEMR